MTDTPDSPEHMTNGLPEQFQSGSMTRRAAISPAPVEGLNDLPDVVLAAALLASAEVDIDGPEDGEHRWAKKWVKTIPTEQEHWDDAMVQARRFPGVLAAALAAYGERKDG